VEPIVLGVFILHFVLFVNYKDSEYFLFLRYLIPILLLTIVGYLTLPISGGFKLRNFGGTKLRITSFSDPGGKPGHGLGFSDQLNELFWLSNTMSKGC
jgi:hypothetical protein